MEIIKLNATTSTNTFLRQLASEQQLQDYTVVVCGHQTQGRGQLGTTWQSEPFKNLTFSFLKKDICLRPTDQFKLNMAVSLAVFEVLHALSVPRLKVKWPNDIMSANKKIAGILIENFIKGDSIQKSIVGIGLNVNQTNFDGMQKVGSLRLLLGKDTALETLLDDLMEKIKQYFVLLHHSSLKTWYEAKLFKLNEKIYFEALGDKFRGSITGVDEIGRLVVAKDAGSIQTFGLKEIKMYY